MSCAVEQEKEERVAGQRTRSESSLPISLPEVDGGESETGSDSVFNRRAAAGTKQCPSKIPSGTGSSVQSSLNRAMAALGSQTCSSGRDTEGADETTSTRPASVHLTFRAALNPNSQTLRAIKSRVLPDSHEQH